MQTDEVPTGGDADEPLTRDLLPEERAAGIDDAEATTAAVLEESEQRVNDDDAGIGDDSGEHEHRASEETA